MFNLDRIPCDCRTDSASLAAIFKLVARDQNKCVFIATRNNRSSDNLSGVGYPCFA